MKLLGGLIALITILVLTIVFVATASDRADACEPGRLDAAAAYVDVSRVPEGPIAGYGHDRLVNAAHIMSAAQHLGLTLHDQRIGVMTAMGESGLQVLEYGDEVGPDSRGLFQQRANGAWGSLADRMDPFISATNFFKALVEVPGHDTLEPTIAAHRTQINADPHHYEKYWDAAVQVVAAIADAGSMVVAPAAASTTPEPIDGVEFDPQYSQAPLVALVRDLAPRFGIERVGGWRAEARDPTGHPSGLAADFMIDPGDRSRGDELAAYARQHAAELGVDYIIWWQRIWSVDRAAEGWRPMEGRGSPTENHMDHVHINVRADADPTVVGVDDAAGCVETVAATGAWRRPVDAEVTSDFGMRLHPTEKVWKLHAGTDYGASCGTPIYPASTGTVVRADPDPYVGNVIEIDHGGGISTQYQHMENDGVWVRRGDVISDINEAIGAVGRAGSRSTGCHLHFEVHRDGEPIDPEPFIEEQLARAEQAPTGSITIVQANVRNHRSDVATARATGADFITLNEVSGISNLSGRGYLAWRSRPCRPGDFRTCVRSQQRGTAVAWRSDRWSDVSHGVEQITTGDHRWMNRYAHWITLRRIGGSGTVSVISTHAMTAPLARRHPREYAAGMATLNDLIRDLSVNGPVLLGGDLNQSFPRRGGSGTWYGPTAQLGLSGAQSTFTLLGSPRNGWATHRGGGTIDYIFRAGALTPTAHRTMPLRSDHDALIATFTSSRPHAPA